MANITTCGKCGKAYEAGSEEQANEPGGTCQACRWAAIAAQGRRAPGGDVGILDLVGDIAKPCSLGRSPVYLFRSFYPGSVLLRCRVARSSGALVEEQIFPSLDEAAGHLVSRGYCVIVVEEWARKPDLTVEQMALEAMEGYGGSFVKAMARAFMAADETNKRALRIAFAHYFDEYAIASLRDGGGR